MADETQEDITSIVAGLERKIKDETSLISRIYRNYDTKIITQIETLDAIVEANKKGILNLLEQSKLQVQNIEFKRRVIAAGNPALKATINSIWADPDRGPFMPVN